MKLRHFSIRDLLWLFVVVALATGWGVDRVRLETARRNELVERQKAMSAARQAQYAASLAAANRSLQIGYSIQGAGVPSSTPAGAKMDSVTLLQLAQATDGEPAELRTWSRGDFTLEARFDRLDGENVILSKADGAEVSVPLKELSAGDQCIATMAGPAEAVPAP